MPSFAKRAAPIYYNVFLIIYILIYVFDLYSLRKYTDYEKKRGLLFRQY